MDSSQKPVSQRLLQIIRARTAVNLAECFQCQKCSAGCPLAEETDLLPHALIKKVHLGREEEILLSKHIWLCLSCETCATRCPNQVDLCKVIDELRRIALEQGVEVAEPDIAAFHQIMLGTLKRHGRMYELEMIARLKLRTREYFKDAGMGLGMLRRGKLSFLPSRVKNQEEVVALFDRERKRMKG
jgi:heterodisulfide reductase subunit C